MNNQNLSRLLGYEFKNKKLLENALTHSSSINEIHQEYCQNNERLEFLGDALLDAIISEYLYVHLAKEEEGLLTKTRAAIVCEDSLGEIGLKLGIGQALILGNGEERNGGRNRISMIADGVEALIGAVYMDSGWEAVSRLVLRVFKETIDLAIRGELYSDYKTGLQEKLQVNGDVWIQYVMDREEGPDHDKIFYVSVLADGVKLGNGKGRSKKEAEQNAAKIALQSIR